MELSQNRYPHVPPWCRAAICLAMLSFAHSTSAGQLRFVAKDFYGFLLQIGQAHWANLGVGGGRPRKWRRERKKGEARNGMSKVSNSKTYL